MTVLLLNVSYEPRGVITLKRAISLLHRGKVVPVGDTFEQVRTAHTVLNIPRVLRLIYYVNVPRTKARWSAKAMHKRDNHRCGYCGIQGRELTVDHIVPKSKGGKNTWQNTISACGDCNRRKANRTPTQAGMPLLFQPGVPKGGLLVFSGSIPEDWAIYVEV